ncbi:TIGR04206 family protein [Haloplanus halophilus]|uniref:TIGR04206 family protein n=1 Tax=Haloplanus halophilus TaxID=2949993 RepID=UPI00203FED73|nr:TIGR04206 family protein [Haloplanus sp. GDY1]
MSDRSAADPLAVLALLAVPWSVQTFAGARPPTFVFAWGLVTVDPFAVTFLWDFLLRYTRGLPPYITAWPLSVGSYLLALASAAGGYALGREDPRVTAGLLAAAGVAQLTLARGFAFQPGRTAWPLGTVACLAVAWWVYR